MEATDSNQRYGSIARGFHWTIFSLFLFQFVIAIVMNGVASKDYYPAALFVTHKSMGVTLFFLALARLAWRKRNPLPPWPDSMSAFEKKAFKFLETGLYAVMILMPLFGYVYSMAGGHGFKFFGLFEVPDLIGKSAVLHEIGKYAHRITAFIIVAFVTAHVSLILRRHFDSRENFLGRMCSVTKNEPPAASK